VAHVLRLIALVLLLVVVWQRDAEAEITYHKKYRPSATWNNTTWADGSGACSSASAQAYSSWTPTNAVERVIACYQVAVGQQGQSISCGNGDVTSSWSVNWVTETSGSIRYADCTNGATFTRTGNIQSVTNQPCNSETETDPTAPCYVAPEPAFDCSALANVNTLAVADGVPDSFTPKDTGCVGAANINGVPTSLGQGCSVFKRATQKYKRMGPANDREWLVSYQFTGLECDAEPPAESLTFDDEPEEKCKTGAGGLTWCEAPNADGDCGFFNDKYICLQSLGEDQCESKADGSRLCAASAPTPPVPDSGTPGVPAPADDSIVTSDGTSSTTYNYYNSTTVSNSSRDPGTGGGTGGSGTVGPGGEPEEESGSASGGITCDSEPSCAGDPIQCAILKQQWRTRCVEAPTEPQALEAIGATAGEIDGSEMDAGQVDVTTLNTSGTLSGSCPVPLNVSVMGQNLSLDIWHGACEMAVLFAPFVMAMGYLLSAMLFIKGLRV